MLHTNASSFYHGKSSSTHPHSATATTTENLNALPRGARKTKKSKATLLFENPEAVGDTKTK